jgi:Enolase C-terminal domain-like/Mandelate racemase / muconate lactonizing enzyme, N-terminal domain
MEAGRALTIERIDLVAIRVPLDRTYRGSKYRMTHRSTIITQVHTAAGIVGEAYAGDEDAGLEEIVAIIRDEITPQLIGLDARAVERCWEKARPATFDILRDRRLGLVACACVDAAIWDAIGKAVGEPLWRLWGGYRNSIPVTSIGGYYGTGVSIEEEIAELQSRGLAGMKFKVGGLSPAEDAQRFIEARKAAGDEFILMADANQGWQVHEAVDFARRAMRVGERPAGDARRAADERTGRVRRAERVLGRRLPRSLRRRRRRLLQLRRFVVGWANRMATRRGDGCDVWRAHGPPRGSTGVQSPAVLDPARNVRGDLPRAT